MRTLVLVAALSLAAFSLSALSPGASAFGWCSEAGAAVGHYCYAYFLCIGETQYGCQYGIEDPCHTTTECYPPDGAAVLP